MRVERGVLSRIARHEVDFDWCRERAAAQARKAGTYVQAIRQNLNLANAGRVMAEQYAGYLAVVEPASGQIGAAVRLGAQAMAALFAGAVTPAREVEVQVGEGPPAKVPASVTSDLHDVGNWLGGFFLAAIARESRLLDALCAVPVDLLRRSTTRAEEYAYFYAEALSAFWRREAEAPRLLLGALQATDPRRLESAATEYVLDLVVPQMDVLFRVMDGDAVGVNIALAKALERHRGYWAEGEKQRDPRAYIAFPLTALAALAHDAGLPVEVESDYLPPALVVGAFS